ncbi:hypothetical protein ACIBF1_26570 [Spirillospora sp. NPDC050679]
MTTVTFGEGSLDQKYRRTPHRAGTVGRDGARAAARGHRSDEDPAGTAGRPSDQSPT